MIKKLVLIIGMTILPFFIYAQADSQRENPEYRDVFCQIIVEQKFMSSKMKMSVDYGLESSSWVGSFGKVRDEQSGKVKKFNSQVDALNYMTEEGWTYVSSMVLMNQSALGATYAFYYLLRRQIPFAGY